MSTHGYGPYANGCRCEVCRRAKADYMRERRAVARAAAALHTSTPNGKRANSSGNAFAPGATRFIAKVRRHGTRYAYEKCGCRCRDCTTARTQADYILRRRRIERAS